MSGAFVNLLVVDEKHEGKAVIYHALWCCKQCIRKDLGPGKTFFPDAKCIFQ